MTTETELLQKLTIQISHGEREYDPEDIFRLLEMTRRLRNGIQRIRRHSLDYAQTSTELHDSVREIFNEAESAL